MVLLMALAALSYHLPVPRAPSHQLGGGRRSVVSEHRARPAAMGVPGFITWLETNAPESIVEIDSAAPRKADVVAFDLNSLVHGALRNSRDEQAAIVRIFQTLHRALRCVQPQSAVVLALDGAAPLAKIETQRKRRSKTSAKSARKQRGVSPLCATPGTAFMATLEDALTFWCCAELSTQRARHLTLDLSGSDVPGEGEVKLVDWLLSHAKPRGPVVLVGGDGDLVLQARVWHDRTCTPCVHTHMCIRLTRACSATSRRRRSRCATCRSWCCGSCRGRARRASASASRRCGPRSRRPAAWRRPPSSTTSRRSRASRSWATTVRAASPRPGPSRAA